MQIASREQEGVTARFEDFEHESAAQVVAWAAESFGKRAALASSFGVEDMVLTDMICKTEPRITIFTLDTGRLPEETYQLMDETRAKYGVSIEVYFPDARKVEEMVRSRGMNLFYESLDNRKMCCAVRKVEPLGRALSDKAAWLTGLRRDQTSTRANVSKVAADPDRDGVLKISPIADWSSKQVWDYVRANNVPYNVLHDSGFPSIGCEPCTRAVKEGEDPRSGRWWWEQGYARECGLHYKH
jgi:phosphoadenosine phosphosulfate reductase